MRTTDAGMKVGVLLPPSTPFSLHILGHCAQLLYAKGMSVSQLYLRSPSHSYYSRSLLAIAVTLQAAPLRDEPPHSL